MNLYIIAGCVLLIALTIGALWLRSQLARRREHNEDIRIIQKWIDRVNEASTPQDVADVGYFEDPILKHDEWHYSAKIWDVPGYRDAGSRLDKARVTLVYHGSDVVGKVELLAGFLKDFQRFPPEAWIGLSYNELPDEITKLVNETRDAAADGGASEVLLFNRLRYLDIWPRLMSHNVPTPTCPENWNQQVATHFKTPGVRMFDGLMIEPKPGMVRLLAAKALDDRSLVDGKLVLAFCDLYKGEKQRRFPYRDEIGDVLIAELAKMVHAIHVAQRLFQES